jgi:hypothetical protein
MTPFETARATHEGYGIEPFHQALAAHLAHGVVISTAEVFLLMRPVDTRARHALFDDPAYVFDNPNCWHCYLAAGDMTQFGRYIPYELPFISYVKRNRLRILPLSQTTFLHGWKTKTRRSAVQGGTDRSTDCDETGEGRTRS